MKLSNKITTHLLSGEYHLLRRLCTAVSPAPASTKYIPRYELYKKVSNVGYTGEKVTDVLNHLTQSGFYFENSDLDFCFNKLRQYRRHNHCLELLDWMENGAVESPHYAKRLNLIYQLEGIEKAEKYFDSLPPAAKKPYMYESLLNCYCSESMVIKALALFEKMDEMKYTSRESTFNNLMGLFIKVDQPEKVPSLIEEMKQRNIPLNKPSYYIWIQSYGCLKNLEGVEKVMDEVKRQTSLKDDWKIYSTLASAYIKIGQSGRVDGALKKMEEILDNAQDYVNRVAYHHLITLYGNNGDSESVFRAWDKLKSKFTVCHNISYCIMLQTLSKLDDIEGLRKCFNEWQSRYKSYDIRLINIVIKAYLRHDLLEKAEMLLKDAVGKNEQKLWSHQVSFMDYYLRKQQIDPAFRHATEAIVDGWRPHKEKIDLFFEHFKEAKDVCGAERLCSALKKGKHMDSRAYLWLLQIYAAADKTAPTLRQRMKVDQASVSTEHEELLSKVCPI